MNPALQQLLDLRREAEDCAQEALAAARALRVASEEAQTRLRTRSDAALDCLESETRRLATASMPMTAAEASAGATYLGRLRSEARRLAERADEHHATTLAAAKKAEDEAQAGYTGARSAREAVENLIAREENKVRQIAERRSEDGASDLAQAAFVRRQREEN